MSLTVHRFDSVDAFLAATGGFLAAREAEHNLIWGITSQLRHNAAAYDGPPTLVAVTHGAGRVVAASLRTPPWNQVLSLADDPEAVDALVDALTHEALPGVIGPSEEAARFADRWSAATGQRAELEMHERIFRLTRVVPPARPAEGRWRMAEPRDTDTVAEWIVAFHEEATPTAPAPDDPLRIAEGWIDGGHRFTYLWEDGGRVVSLAVAGGETPNGIRIGPVYTPSELRGHGYASTLTAAASHDQLDRGHRFVFLFTDLSNPISNRIYRAIGYEPVCDMDVYRFAADA